VRAQDDPSEGIRKIDEICVPVAKAQLSLRNGGGYYRTSLLGCAAYEETTT
jgi:hypothetical protein